MIRSRLTELRQQAVESLPSSRGRGHSSTRCGRWCPASSSAPLRARSPMRASTRGEVLAAVALAGALALWARISQARRSAPYLRTRTGVAISGLIVAWPRESFLAFLATPDVVKDLRLWGWCDAYSASSFRKWGLLA